MSDEKQVDLTKFTFQDYLDDKEKCERIMTEALEEFRVKYDLNIQSASAELIPGFGDEIAEISGIQILIV